MAPTRAPSSGTGPATDASLWERVQDGDRGSFAQLFDRYASVIYRYSMTRVRRPDWAEEVVSYVFAEAWRQRDRIELTDGLLRPWLLGVARNRSNRTWTESVRHRRPQPGQAAPDQADHADLVAAQVDAQRTLDRVLDAVAALPDGPREVLTLHVWGELTQEQIATELGIELGTVKSRLHRARRRLLPVVHPSADASADDHLIFHIKATRR